jgi:hypothetical protein
VPRIANFDAFRLDHGALRSSPSQCPRDPISNDR